MKDRIVSRGCVKYWVLFDDCKTKEKGKSISMTFEATYSAVYAFQFSIHVIYILTLESLGEELRNMIF